MTAFQSQVKTKTSLRFQYIVSAIVVVALFFIGSLIASFYFKYATEKNTSLINLHKIITVHVDELRNSVWEADKSLYVLLSDSENVNDDIIKSRFNYVDEKLKKISNISDFEKVGLLEHLNNLKVTHDKLNAEVILLLDLRKDVNWLFPILPLINTTLTESNNKFETALNQALIETYDLSDKKHSNEAYRVLDDIKNIWSLKRLDFRGALIRYAGLNTINKSQEKNIEDYYSLIKEKLKKLDAIDKASGLGFVTKNSLQVMRTSSIQWYKEYKTFLEVKNTNSWRSDVDFIRNKIQPLQKQIFDQLESLEKTLNLWASINTKHVDAAGKKINVELWFLTGIAILFVILIYFKFNKSLLLPLEKITESIAEHAGDTENMIFPERGSKEIDILITAFNNMRKQVHHRQMVLEFQAMHDSLTGLPNRALLQDRIEQAINQAERNNTGMTLLLLDLDRFKDINDTLGHPVGDIVLRKISRRLEDCLRATDTVARLGGDEFAIITSYSERSQIESFIDRIIKNIERVITIADQNLYVGLSVGVASFPKDGLNADTLIQHADIAMYSAKRENKNKEFYDIEKDYYSADNLTLLADLKAEFKNPTDKIQLYFQPQIDVHTGEVICVESLIRWNHPVQGYLPAEQIVRMAEQTGLISELTYWVLSESIKVFSKWDCKDITFSINLSVWNLQDVELIPYISRILNDSKIQPEKISFEITESAVMNDPVRAREVLQLLNEMGIELAIDDYGTGFSSLAYLKLLPVKYLKIDKSFVVDMLNDEDDAIIVHSTIELAHNLGLAVIAEGVETEKTLIKLRELGCDYAQGYYIAKPMPSTEIQQWVKNHKPN
ncbi:MAG: EAL domain-containing protein, partial [Gammaproteobacteria bacterium]|nr:EAL domain-containing protein [Gammaproteobacteria bacterium]